MKYLIRIIFAFLMLLVVSFLIFYFWASSASSPKTGYYKVVNFTNHEAVVKDTFCIMTYNIGYLSGLNNNLPLSTSVETSKINLNRAIKVISEVNPDFLSLQEIDYDSHRSNYYNQFDSIGEADYFEMGAMAVNWDKKYVPFPYWPPSVHFGKLLSGQAILSKYNISGNMVIKLPKPKSNPFYYNAFYLDRLIQTANIKLGNDREVQIINVHLEAFDKLTRELQSNILINYLKSIPQSVTYLVAGDFNSRPPYSGVEQNNEKTIRNLLDIGLVPAVDEATYLISPKNYLTFSSQYPVEKIDYIFYDPKKVIKINAYVVVRMGEISDHLPLAMKFILKNQRP